MLNKDCLCAFLWASCPIFEPFKLNFRFFPVLDGEKAYWSSPTRLDTVPPALVKRTTVLFAGLQTQDDRRLAGVVACAFHRGRTVCLPKSTKLFVQYYHSITCSTLLPTGAGGNFWAESFDSKHLLKRRRYTLTVTDFPFFSVSSALLIQDSWVKKFANLPNKSGFDERFTVRNICTRKTTEDSWKLA